MDESSSVRNGQPFGVALGCAALLAVGVLCITSAMGQSVPPHLYIVESEFSTISATDGVVGDREVRLSITVLGPPPCDAANAGVAYGMLVDSDANADTGLPIDSLGIDARLSVECDGAPGTFSSTIGAVAIATEEATGLTTIELSTTIEQLPSVDFLWVAYATDGALLVNAPEGEAAPRWSTIERAIP